MLLVTRRIRSCRIASGDSDSDDPPKGPLAATGPDVRTATFAAEAHRQASLVAGADENNDEQDFIEAISTRWDEE